MIDKKTLLELLLFLYEQGRPIGVNEIENKFNISFNEIKELNEYKNLLEEIVYTDFLDLIYADHLERFLIDEIGIILEDENKEISLKELRDIITRSFYHVFWDNRFTTSHINFESLHNGDDFLLKIIKKNDHLFYIKDEDSFSDYFIKIGNKKWIEEKIFEAEKILRNEIVFSIFKPLNKISFTLSKLTQRTNRSVNFLGLPKPYGEELIEKIIKDNPDRFIYNEETKTVELVDDLIYLENSFNKNKQLLKDFNSKSEDSGFLAFSFIGKSFPLNEAKDYISTRPIIYITTIENLSEEFQNLIENKESELIEILSAILPEDTKILEWINQNLAVSFVEFDEDYMNLIRNQVIEKFSPIFNLNDNPGNLFQYTLKNKLEEYRKKFVNEKTDSEIDYDKKNSRFRKRNKQTKKRK